MTRPEDDDLQKQSGNLAASWFRSALSQYKKLQRGVTILYMRQLMHIVSLDIDDKIQISNAIKDMILVSLADCLLTFDEIFWL